MYILIHVLSLEIACIRILEKKTIVSPIYVLQRRHQEVNDGAQLKLVEQRMGVQSMMAPILGGSLVLADCCYAMCFPGHQ